MPVTRSQKGDSERSESREPEGASTEKSSHTGSEVTSGASVVPTDSATASTSKEETSGTSESTNTMATAEQVRTTMESKGAEQDPEQWAQTKARSTTSGPGSASRVRSVRTTRTTTLRKRKELEAREELARIELEQARVESKLARIRWEKALQSDSDEDDDNQVLEDRTEQVQDWIDSSLQEERNTTRKKDPSPELQKESKSRTPAAASGATFEVQALAEALKQAFGIGGGSSSQPKYIHELPTFDGNSGEWISFKVVYEDTSSMFSDVQNMARLRRAIKGSAREAIKSLLYSEAPPTEVMEALRRRYGRPDVLVLTELSKIKNLPRLSDNPRDICVFASQISNSVAAIRGLKKPQYLHSPEMVKQIVDKLPTILKFRWYDYTDKHDEKEFADLALISKFLNKEADKCGAFASAEERTFKKPGVRQTAHATANREVNPTAAKGKCLHCQGEHYLLDCHKFKRMPVQERWASIIKLRVCFKCLEGRHRKESCSKPPCKICRRWHHHLLHKDMAVQEPGRSSTQQNHKSEADAASTNITSQVNALKSTRAYLKMAPVEIFGPRGSKKILALLDEGSTVSLLDERIAEIVGATGTQEELVLATVGGKLIKKKNSRKVNLTIKGVHQGEKRRLQQVRTVDELQLSPQHVEKKRILECPHLRSIADALYHEGESPRLLIGQDNWELIVSQKVLKGRPGQPVASLTGLGWVLHGADSRQISQVHFINRCMHVNQDEEMHGMIKDHFSIESLGVLPKRPTTDSEGRAIKILEETSNRLPDGRFEAGMIWKEDNIMMPDNYDSAEKRLRTIERKIEKDPQLKKEYGEQIHHLTTNGYAEEVPEDDKDTQERVWYLPHFSVVHPVKKKIRIVFDAAAKTKGMSLNDALLPGPDLLQSLFGVLLRFRQGPIAVAADIKEMFLQIRIRNEDRDSLRFLWREDRRDVAPKKFRMTSVIFGATSSPSTAIFIKNRNAADFQEQYPEAVKAIERNHYMDDYLHSFHSENKVRQLTKEVDSIHRKAKFELRGWASNRPELLSDVVTETPTKKEVEIGEKEEKTLGLRWLTEDDSIAFRANLRTTPEDVLKEKRMPTKREVTSAVMSTFDPLGLASPVLIQGKKLIQAIWRSGIGWDEEILAAEYENWRAYVGNMGLLRDLRLSRCVSPHTTEGELHIFADASEEAYAAAVYWRTKREDGNVEVHLVAGKARVTPLKPVSVPRLELQAALLGARLARAIEDELDFQVSKKTYWSDSSIVLSWIKTDPRTFKTFVAHRLAEIEDLTRPQEWRWVPTALNPADDATRRIPEDFNHRHRWFRGPEFLHNEEDKWPAPRSFKKEKTEEDKTTETVTAVKEKGYATPAPERFSSWTRLLRATARVLQFIELCRTKEKVYTCDDPTWGRTKKIERKDERKLFVKQTKQRLLIPIGDKLMQEAEKMLLQRSQDDSFQGDARKLQKGLPLETGSKLKKLDVELVDKLIRIKGRIDAAPAVTTNYKRPVVLDSKHHITKLIIEHYHRKFNHGNHSTVLNEIRQRFLVLGIRSSIKSIIHHCQWCRVTKRKPSEVPTGNLPAERMQHGAPPFTNTGVDYFGPMTITVGRRHEKRWGALFTCLTTRAVHIELAPSLTTGSMLLALRRFAARRGMPKLIYSDNGTNFVGAKKELEEAFSNMNLSAMEFAADQLGVRWKFIPPGAPNMGGAWERLVRSIKIALAATLKERHPREETLHTLLLEAEHMVNSRPLTQTAENTEEEALTPNHFLIGRSCGATNFGVFTDHDLVGRETWKAAQRLADHFWRRWLREYLPTLLLRKIDGRTSSEDLRVGDVVLIVDATLPRCTWPRGRIQEVYPGPDGRTRIIDVETRGGVLRRPSSRLVLLTAGPSPCKEDGATHEGENVGDRPT